MIAGEGSQTDASHYSLTFESSEMSFPAPSADLSRGGSQFKDGHPESRQSVLVQSGETDDVEVVPEIQTKTKPDVKPWAHLLAGGYVFGTGHDMINMIKD